MPVDNRLRKIAGMIRRGDTVADVGTDHGYLPVFLVKNGISPKAFACDVADGPLKNARATIEKSNVTAVELRKGDGLAAVSPDEADTFVIAGMGGELIADILHAAPWIKNPRYELILQPMTSAEDLRKYLCDNGFLTLEERAVSSAGRLYTVIKAGYIGEKQPCGPLFYYAGRLTENMGGDEIAYLQRKRRILTKLAADLENIPEKNTDYRFICAAISEIDALLEDSNGN